MRTNQPEWKFVANLGDAHPIDHGGFFVFEDTTGVYAPEAELLESPDSDDGTWTVYRFSLDKCTLTLTKPLRPHAMAMDGYVLSNNKFHPEMPAWFAKPELEYLMRPQDTTYLSCVAKCHGVDLDELRRMFCSDNILERAMAYRAVGDFHGFENFDSYPLTFTERAEVEKRYPRATWGS